MKGIKPTEDDARYVAEAYGYLVYQMGTVTGGRFAEEIKRRYDCGNPRNQWAADIAEKHIGHIAYNGHTTKYNLTNLK